MNRISRLLVSMLASSAIDRGFGSDRAKPKTKIGIRCFFIKYAALMSKSKDWVSRSCCFMKHLTKGVDLIQYGWLGWLKELGSWIT